MTLDSISPDQEPASSIPDPAMTIQRPPRISTGAAANGKPVNGSGFETAYSVSDRPLGATKHVRIVGIGAGASGINMIRTLRKTLTDYNFTIYEKNDGVGGTWHENRYPGCRCDVPSHNYQFSWWPNPTWSNFHSPAEEIRQYLCRICEENNMMDSIKLQHQITGAWWDETRGLWDLNVKDLSTGEEFHDQAHYIIDGSGILK
jgi:cation diffusion facilitator CzcD-associated flavoprotein CzcO